MSELKHHGILGMKWGVRRFQNKDRTLTAEGKKRYRKSESTEQKNAELKPKENSKSIKKSVSEMTDEELRERVKRLNMEQQYKNLTEEQVKKGKGKVKKIVEAAGTVSTALATAIAIKNSIDTIKKWKKGS